RYLDPRYSPDTVAAEVGIPAATIRRIAAELAEAAFEQQITLDIPWTDWAGRRHETMIGRPVAMHAMRGISAHSNGFHTPPARPPAGRRDPPPEVGAGSPRVSRRLPPHAALPAPDPAGDEADRGERSRPVPRRARARLPHGAGRPPGRGGRHAAADRQGL